MTNFRQALQLFERAASRAVATVRSAPDKRWALVADTFEHMAIANELNCKRLTVLVRREPDKSFQSALEDDEIPYLFWRAPEPPGLAVPTGAWNDRDEAIERFQDGASRFSDLANFDDGNMRLRGDSHPLFGPLDAVQWGLFAAAHTERHRAELIGFLSTPHPT